MIANDRPATVAIAPMIANGGAMMAITVAVAAMIANGRSVVARGRGGAADAVVANVGTVVPSRLRDSGSYTYASDKSDDGENAHASKVCRAQTRFRSFTKLHTQRFRGDAHMEIAGAARRLSRCGAGTTQAASCRAGAPQCGQERSSAGKGPLQ
jgi:hypothetical protein